MANQWLRLYAEFATDPKIQMMSESYQRRYVMLLCLRCCNGDVTLQDSEVAFQLRICDEEWCATKAVFVSKNLINTDNKPAAWDRRQFVSDSSAARVSRHREKKKQECNVTVTPPDTDTDTEVNQTPPTPQPSPRAKKTESAAPVGAAGVGSGFAEFWLAYPRKVGKAEAERKWKTLKPDAGAVLSAVKRQSASEQWRKDGGRYVPNPSTWLHQRRWEDEPAQSPANSTAITLSLIHI
jgi:hypothetical protein